MTKLFGAMAAFAIACASMIAAVAAPARTCEMPNDTATTLRARIDQVRIITLAGPRVARFLKAFNAEPPVSDYAADTLLIARAPMKLSVLLVMYENGCLKHAGAISPDLYRRVWQASHDTGRHI